MEDSWENWISHLDMNVDNFSINDIEEHRRDSTQQPTFSSKTNAETHSMYPSSLEELGFMGQCPNSSNAGIWEHSSKQDSNCEQFQLGHSWPHLSLQRTLVGNQNIEPRANQGTKRARSSFETQDHIMSERKRRQEMAERFIALSAIIPGLKKIDKASVLRETINYVKQLQERIAVLEQESKRKGRKSMIFTKKSRPCSASCETNCNGYYGSNQVLPEVEVIGLELEKEVLIRIHCEKRKGILLKLSVLLANIHLSIATSSILPFGNNTLNITIIAQMGEKYSMTVNELVKNLRHDLLKLYDMQP